MCDRSDAIGFLDAQFSGMANDSFAICKRAGNRQYRQFINELRHFSALNHCTLERKTGDFDDPPRFQLIDVFDGLAHLRTHSQQNAKQRCARVV